MAVMDTDIANQMKEMQLAAEDETVAIDPDLLVKHPLQNQWTLWYYKNDRSKGWEENLQEVITFDTIEDFWSVFNHIKASSELSSGCDYSLFKTGIKPMWEDPRNSEGGRWLISLDKKQRNSELDWYWQEVILCLIGEAFDEHSDDVCGAVVNIRGKGDKISVWTSNSKNHDGIMRIGRKLKESLKIPPKSTIVYEAHKDTMVKSGSMAKYRFTV